MGIAEALEQFEEKKCKRSEIAPAAIEFAGNRPIELYDSSAIVDHVRGAMS